VQRYNGDLANGYGNLVSRVVNMVHKYFGGVVPEVDVNENAQLREASEALVGTFSSYFDTLDFSRALESLWAFVAIIDFFLTSTAPWKKPADVPEEAQQQFRAKVLYAAAEAIRVITALAYPIVPDAAAKVWVQLGLGELAVAAKNGFLKDLVWGGLKAGTKFGEPAPLFPRAEKEAIERMQSLEDENSRTVVEAAGGGSTVGEVKAPIAAEKPEPVAMQVKPAVAKAPLAATKVVAPVAAKDSAPLTAPGAPAASTSAAAPVVAQAAAESAAQGPQHITIDDFAKVELRVAQILVAERVPKADKLLRLEVDLGTEKRQILAGIAEFYEPEKLIGRRIVIVANLAPRKMRGLESNGMLLAASLEGGAPVLAGFLEDVPLGARLK
jgi:methionyl-tRNA synthetase